MTATSTIAASGGTTFSHEIASLLNAKNQTIAVCIPARNEADTIGGVVGSVVPLCDAGLVDDLVVIDDGSTDATAPVAHSGGATVVTASGGPGKGQALSCAVDATDAGILVFLDADVANFSSRFITQLLAPLLDDPVIELVKAFYRRPCNGRPGEGGRVTELLARPLLRRFYPELARIGQPLAGECAIRRTTLDAIDLVGGYGIEIGLLIDVYQRFGSRSIAEVDLGERVHRNRSLPELRGHSDDILGAVLDRTLTTSRGE